MWLPIGLALTALLLFGPIHTAAPVRSFSYSGFVTEVISSNVSTATITSTGAVSGTLVGGAKYTSQIPTALNDTSLSPLLLVHKVTVTGANASTTSLSSVLVALLPLVALVGIFIWIGRKSRRQMASGLGGIMGFGRSKAKVYDEEKPAVRFSDIAGYEGTKAR
jgi:cell division protease FtsH